MIKLEKYTGNKTYMYPSGKLASPEIIESDYPAVTVFPHVLEVSGNVCQAIMELGSLRQLYGIPETLTDDEAIEAIQTILNTPPPAPEPTPEERIAAAMEYDNLMKY